MRRANRSNARGSMPTGKTADLGLLAVDPHGNLTAGSLEHAHVVHRVAFGHQIANEISRIALGLKTDDVVFEQQRNELLVVGQRRQNLGWRERNVQEEADAIGMAAPPQRGGDRDQVVVVNPDQIVLVDHLFQFGGEVLVDAEIAAQIAAREFREIKPVMQDRPQHAIGEAVVIFLIVVVREIGDDILDVLVLDRSRFPASSVAATLPLQPSQTPPFCCSVGRSATSSPPARLAPSPAGTETLLETTTNRANTDPPNFATDA